MIDARASRQWGSQDQETVVRGDGTLPLGGERERRLVFNNNRCGSSTSGETSLNSVSVRVNGERIYRDRNRQSVEGGGSRRRGTKGGPD